MRPPAILTTPDGWAAGLKWKSRIAKGKTCSDMQSGQERLLCVEMSACFERADSAAVAFEPIAKKILRRSEASRAQSWSLTESGWQAKQTDVRALHKVHAKLINA